MQMILGLVALSYNASRSTNKTPYYCVFRVILHMGEIELIALFEDERKMDTQVWIECIQLKDLVLFQPRQIASAVLLQLSPGMVGHENKYKVYLILVRIVVSGDDPQLDIPDTYPGLVFDMT